MRRFLVLMVAVLVSAFASTSDSEAKRRGGSFGGKSSSRSIPVIVPIPGSGSSVVFVKDLPDLPAFKFEDKGHFDLGYKFGMFGGGEWVGYFKKESGYLELDQAKVISLVLPLVGLTEADAPKRSAGQQASAAMWWVFIGVAAFGFLMLRSKRFRSFIFALRGQKNEGDDEPSYGTRFAEYSAPMAEPRRSMMAAASRAPVPSAGFGRAAPAGSFGKRR